MKLAEVEKKLYKRCTPQHPKSVGKGGFILSDGKFVSCTDHAALCRSIGTTLKSVLRVGLCRFFSRSGLGGNVAVFEFRKALTDAQKMAVKSLLKHNVYHYIICGDETIESQTRPIRSIPSIHKKK